MGDTGWGIVFVLGLTAAIAAVIIVALWQIFAVARTEVAAKTALARDDAFRSLASEVAAAHQAIADEQRKIAADLAELRERTTSIEKMMREVG